MFDDVIRIQLICGGCALLLAPWNITALHVCAMKLIFCGYGTQVGHYYAHLASSGMSNRVPKIVTLLQRCHVLLPPAHHRKHHQAPHDCNFGIVSGVTARFLNPICRASVIPHMPAVALWAAMTALDIAIVTRGYMWLTASSA